MANIRNKRNQNREGNFFVDNSCIDCGTCYWMAPEVFKKDKEMSAVFEQPTNETRAMQALISCPTNSIGYSGPRVEMRKVSRSFPISVEENIYHTGFHAESSYGAASYFIQRENGNVLIDSPRYSSVITKNIKDLGGVKTQFLTHRDDVADTDLYHKDFAANRIMHEDDISDKTKHFETIIKGQDDFQIDDDLLIIPVPGHTKGHTVLLYREKYLFTGDHLAFNRNKGHLYAFRTACWYDWDIQIKSMQKLMNYNFSYILPGHGAPMKSNSPEQMKSELEKCIAWMKK